MMDIKKRDNNHIIVSRTITDRLMWLGVLFPLLVLIWVTDGLSFVILCFIAMFVMGRMMVDGKKLIIEKATENLIFENRILIFFRKRYVIPFKEISRVIIDHDSTGFCIDWRGFWNIDKWKLHIDIYGKIIVVADRNGEKFDWGMFSLAHEITKLTGKELTDMKKKYYYHPNTTKQGSLPK